MNEFLQSHYKSLNKLQSMLTAPIQIPVKAPVYETLTLTYISLNATFCRADNELKVITY